MKKVISLLVYLLVCISCRTNVPDTIKKDNSKKINVQISKDPIESFFESESYLSLSFRSLPLSSIKIDTLYSYNDMGYSIKNEIKSKEANSSYFKIKKDRGIIEENSDGYFYHFFYDYERQFYPIYKIKIKEYTVIGVLTFFYGENDIRGIQFELHSFNKEGEQLDYLLAYCRFNFEISYKNDFTIDKNFKITIEKEMINYFDGSLENERETPLITKRIENYSLNENGIFEKLNN